MNKLILAFFALFLSISSFAQLGVMAAAERTLTSVENVVQGAQQKVDQIESVINSVKDNNLYKSLIDGNEFSFPIGVLPNDGDRNYAIFINKVFMTPDGMYAEVFMKIKVSSKTSLFF